jgi:hypothetical protein
MTTRLCNLALLASLAASPGCSTATSHSIYVPSAQIRSSISTGPGSHKLPQQRARRSAAGLVEESLHARGIRFGTDGSVPALYAFMQNRFARVEADQARGGDVLFFDLGTGCGRHTGLVETAESGGRIGFREWRDGSARHSYVSPREPFLRRDGRGRIMNTFLRPKRMEDPAETTYFAGEMLCAVFRTE